MRYANDVVHLHHLQAMQRCVALPLESFDHTQDIYTVYLKKNL
jgi:hypothetical protein